MNTGTSGASVPRLSPCGTFISSTMIVMMIAMTPSLKASSLFLCIFRSCRGSRRPNAGMPLSDLERPLGSSSLRFVLQCPQPAEILTHHCPQPVGAGAPPIALQFARQPEDRDRYGAGLCHAPQGRFVRDP